MQISRPDHIQLIAAVGSAVGFVGAHYDRIIATFCALICAGYTLWKWRREANQERKQ